MANVDNLLRMHQEILNVLKNISNDSSKHDSNLADYTDAFTGTHF